MMLSFWLGMYYGCVLGFLTAITYRHWESLYDRPRAFIHEEDTGRQYYATDVKVWRRDGGP